MSGFIARGGFGLGPLLITHGLGPFIIPAPTPFVQPTVVSTGFAPTAQLSLPAVPHALLFRTVSEPVPLVPVTIQPVIAVTTKSAVRVPGIRVQAESEEEPADPSRTVTVTTTSAKPRIIIRTKK